MDTGVLSWV